MNIYDVYPAQYEALLLEKVEQTRTNFAPLNIPNIQVFESEREHYRMRAEFTIFHEGSKKSVGDCYYCMFDYPPETEEAAPAEDTTEPSSKKLKLEHPAPAPERKLSKQEKRKLRKMKETSTMRKKERVRIDRLPRASERINELMSQVLSALNASHVLGQFVFQVNFLTSLSGEAVVTMIYHKKLDDEWKQEATELKNRLKCDIVGRSRKQIVLADRNFVVEKLNVKGEILSYKQVEGSFSQPNGFMCEKMLEWAIDSTQGLGGDLLELYCGNGNFGIAMAKNFGKVLGTEISKVSVEAAQFNIDQNKVQNVIIGCLSSEDFSAAWESKSKIQTRSVGAISAQEIDLAEYNFTTVLVDPPRAGLDEGSTKMLQVYDNIVYVSCNPDTLRTNLESLCQTHKIIKFAVFDQFPYTPHLECGVLLVRK